MKTKKQIKIGGLKPLPKDERDFRLGVLFPKPIIVPDIDFSVGEQLEIKDQLDSDMCTAFAVTAASELQEGVTLSPEFQFAKIKELEGSINQWGANLRTALKSATKFGSLEKVKAPFNLKYKDRDFLANWLNWPKVLDEEAKTHIKESYFEADTGKDMFDSIRSALWINREKYRAVITGANWRQSWTWAEDAVIPTEYEPNGFGHAFIITGQKMINGLPHLVAQLSNGTDIGDRGLFYFGREVVNREFNFGAFCFVDLSKGEAKILNNWGLSINWRLLAKIVAGVKEFLKFNPWPSS
jgi:hypothetical protein